MLALVLASFVGIVVCLLTVSVWLLRQRKRARLTKKQSQRHASHVSDIPAQRSGAAIAIAPRLLRIAHSQSAAVEQPTVEEDDVATYPEEKHSGAVPSVAAPESEILEAQVSCQTTDGGFSLDEVQNSRELTSANEGHEGRQVPIQLLVEDVEPLAAAKAQNVAADDADQPETAPLAEVPAGVILLEPKSAAPAAVAEKGDESPRDEATVISDHDPQLESAPGPEETDKTLPRYRPPAQKTPRPAREKARRANDDRAAPAALAATELGIRVHLTFDTYGMCSIGLLPERTAELGNEVLAELGGKPFLLLGQDDWYEDLYPQDIGTFLRDGVELKSVLAGEPRVRWFLSGRDIHVLASSKLARGFVSTNRLVLGRSHVVLCARELLDKAEVLLNEAGCPHLAELGAEEGIPAGWVGLRDVKPTKALLLEPGSDAFYPIKPAPDIEIDLDGGICLGGSVWLSGYPPEIRVLGESAVDVRTLIDGKDALLSSEGVLTADGYDLPGNHSVYCEGLTCSRTYSIEEAPTSWARWPAHRFSKADLCGPLVEMTPADHGRRAVVVSMSNPVLLGALPGQIFHCSRRSVPHWIGFVPFDVVWALPSQPLRSDKKSASILQLRDIPVVAAKVQTAAVLEWSVAILGASRKGLRIENGSLESTASWMQYKKIARSIWRGAR